MSIPLYCRPTRNKCGTNFQKLNDKNLTLISLTRYYSIITSEKSWTARCTLSMHPFSKVTKKPKLYLNFNELQECKQEFYNELVFLKNYMISYYCLSLAWHIRSWIRILAKRDSTTGTIQLQHEHGIGTAPGSCRHPGWTRGGG